MANAGVGLVVWRFCDGKAGHDRQSAGLVKALAGYVDIEAYCFDVRQCAITLTQTLRRQLPYAVHAPDPDLIIGAGRRCQWPLLQARHARGGSAIYLMRPSLPTRLFDLNLIPRHDSPSDSSRIIVTDGVLNDIIARPHTGSDGLVLIGGPSSHFLWNEAHLLEQLKEILAASPNKTWVLTDSRRTPKTTSVALSKLVREPACFVPFAQSSPAWFGEHLTNSDQVWVSSDSVSMIFEALSAGSAVGALEVPAKRSSRVSTLSNTLAQRNMLTTFTAWRNGETLQARKPLAEAVRCAKIILSRWDDASRRIVNASLK